METITLQIKRVTNNWKDHKGYSPAYGEYVLIDVPDADVPKVVILGTGNKEDTLDTLRTKDECINPSLADVISLIDKNIDELKPTSNTQNISSTSDSMGTGNQFAYSNHIHKLEKSTAETILGVDANITTEFNCRKIKVGTLNPLDPSNTSIIGGGVGDIYIMYE